MKVPPEILAGIRGALSAEPVMLGAKLVATVPEATFGHLYQLIADREVYVDLEKNLVVEPDRLPVYRDEATAKAFVLASVGAVSPCRQIPSHIGLGLSDKLTWKGRQYTIANLNEAEVFLACEDQVVRLTRGALEESLRAGEITRISEAATYKSNGELHELLKHASPSDLTVATRRYELIKDPVAAKVARIRPRTLRRWCRIFREAEQTCGHGLVGLLPNMKNRGNRTPRFSERHNQLADEVITREYSNPKQQTKWSSYGVFAVECERCGIVAPSYEWFAKRIGQRDHQATIRARKGKRAAYGLGTLTPGQLNLNHGDAPWQVAYVDHTQIDLECLCTPTANESDRPWLTLVVCGYSRRTLAWCLTYDEPSYRTLMLLIRDCVRRHNRLPNCLVIDGGPEFRGTYFESLCALYEVTLRRRPPAAGRAGTLIERSFGALNTQFFYNLAGNTQITRNVRQVTKSVNPKNLAVWTLEEVGDLLEAYFADIYDQRPHPAFNMTPAQRYGQGMVIGGERSNRRILYDQTFIIQTFPTTPSGVAKVQRGYGVKIHYVYFWSDEMKDPQVEETKIPVRYDPFDASIAYAYIHKRWVKCTSQYRDALVGRSEKELKIATQELRQSRTNLRAHQGLTAKDLALFFEQPREHEKLAGQRRKDAALKRLQAGREKGEPTPTVTQQPVVPPSPSVDSDGCLAVHPSVKVSLEDYGEF
ncbi:MAG TPA: Mu transposase C-terminal domain-containing protein [Verrucomicrobiae bacterium]|jgi:transposase InsO family protein|nr:Mu transposase C-terminal domain-containing protein [Verrucomicrobiae bacterium]